MRIGQRWEATRAPKQVSSRMRLQPFEACDLSHSKKPDRLIFFRFYVILFDYKALNPRGFGGQSPPLKNIKPVT